MTDGGGGRRRPMLLVLFGAALLAAIAAIVALTPRQGELGEIDALIVLGGGGSERLELGTELARARNVPLVLSAEGIDQGRRAGLTCGLDVVCMDPEPSSTAGEARTMRTLADDHGWDRIGVATSTFHVNRSRLLFRQCFGDQVDVVGADGGGSLSGDAYRYARELVAQIAGLTVRRAC